MSYRLSLKQLLRLSVLLLAMLVSILQPACAEEKFITIILPETNQIIFSARVSDQKEIDLKGALLGVFGGKVVLTPTSGSDSGAAVAKGVVIESYVASDGQFELKIPASGGVYTLGLEADSQNVDSDVIELESGLDSGSENPSGSGSPPGLTVASDRITLVPERILWAPAGYGLSSLDQGSSIQQGELLANRIAEPDPFGSPQDLLQLDSKELELTQELLDSMEEIQPRLSAS